MSQTHYFAEPYVDPFGSGDAWQEMLVGADPAVGADFTYKLPGQYISRLVAIEFVYLCSAAAGNRTIMVAFEDGNSSGFAYTQANVDLVANDVSTVSFWIGATSLNMSARAQITGPLPALFLPAGNLLRITAAGKLAGDRILSPTMIFDRHASVGRHRDHRRRHRVVLTPVDEPEPAEDNLASTGTGRPDYYR